MSSEGAKKFNKVYIISIVILFLLVVGYLAYYVYNSKKNIDTTEIIETVADTAVVDTSTVLYGIIADSFEIVKRRVKKNQILANLFEGYNVKPATIFALADSAKAVFDVRKIKTDNKYILFIRNDSIPIVDYLVYEINTMDYVVFQLKDSIHVYLGKKEVDTMVTQLTGIINTSLWVDMVKRGASPDLILALSDVYAWEINFFRINKGDRFKVIYQETIVEDKPVGVNKILGAEFIHLGDTFYAIPFVQNKREDYFDDEGNCLRKMFLQAPLNFRRISSHYSNSRFHPVLKRYRPHHGVDYAAAVGTPVVSVGDGEVVFAGRSGGAGNLVKINHNSVYTTAYMHLSKFGPGIKVGTYVKQSQVIGYVGNTGLSTGPHLDYRVYKNGSAINPLTLKLPPVESISDSNLVDFSKVKKEVVKNLNELQYPAEE